MEEYRKRTERGDGNVEFFLRAVEICGECGFPLPAWVRERVGKARVRYWRHEAKSLDEAFDARRPKYYSQRKRREEEMIALAVFNRCRDLRKQGVKITGDEMEDDLFNIVAQEYNIARTTVSGYYYSPRFAESRKCIDRMHFRTKKPGG